MKSITANITKILYVLLATFPLMKENLNSIIILLCMVFMVFHLIATKEKPRLTKQIVLCTLVFWMYFLYQIISFQFNTKIILLHLPFLIFPLLFNFRPKYISDKIRSYSISTFQISTAIQSIYFLALFLLNNSFQNIFAISNENIPLFRDYVFRNAYFEIHPTYFSIFLLISFTISSLFIINNGLKGKIALIQGLNLPFVVFFIFLFSSKMVMIILSLTIIALFFILIKKFNKKIIFASSLILILTIVMGSFLFIDIIGKRFSEITTEIDKPIVGNYHNSTNIRIAIFNCSTQLIKEVSFFGYGDSLQEHLDICYAQNNSNFYKISTYNTHNYYFNLILYGGYFFLLLLNFFFLLILKKKKLIKYCFL